MNDETERSKPVTATRQFRKGRQTYVDPEWIEQVRVALDRAHQNQTWLAEQIGADKSTVSLLLGKNPDRRPVNSKLVGPICELLGVPRPGEFAEGSQDGDAPEDEDPIRGLIFELPHISPKRVRLLLELARELRTK